MSNNFKFWGLRFGSNAGATKGLVYTVKQMTSGQSISGPHQIAPEPNSPRAKQSTYDRDEFARRGPPSFTYDFKGKKIAGPTWSVA